MDFDRDFERRKKVYESYLKDILPDASDEEGNGPFFEKSFFNENHAAEEHLSHSAQVDFKNYAWNEQQPLAFAETYGSPERTVPLQVDPYFDPQPSTSRGCTSSPFGGVVPNYLEANDEKPYGFISEDEEHDEGRVPETPSPPPKTTSEWPDFLQEFRCSPKKKVPQLVPTRFDVCNPRSLPTPSRQYSAPVDFTQKAHTQPAPGGHRLRTIQEIPAAYQSLFQDYTSFNVVQSTVFDEVLHTDKAVVVSAPTGSGKTVIFELAIVRLLVKNEEKLSQGVPPSAIKIVYVAPLKALCSEKKQDWDRKFSRFGLQCLEITGDTDIDDYGSILRASILLTTPEKWDSLTRTIHDNRKLAKSVKLFLIDEVHCINDAERGATLEAVISRMKTIQKSEPDVSEPVRFLAVSATIPNAEDIAEWLADRPSNGAYFKLANSLRPVKLKTVVLGYFCPDCWTDFRFDLQLHYKVLAIIRQHSDDKPTLIFSPTRTTTQKTAEHLAGETSFVKDPNHRRLLVSLSNEMKDVKLRQTLLKGIAFHHGGLDYHDRRLIEDAFTEGLIRVLVSTTTLAMGVNLPAHLVIIKSTFQYVAGQTVEYSESQVLQMIGRAGRPQFDTSAVAVIMTKTKLENKYRKLVNGTQTIESTLHKYMAEHLNAEIVLSTIKSFWVAMEWIQSTFLYVRVFKNQGYYGIDPTWSTERIENKIQEWCTRELNGLNRYELITMDEDCCNVKPTTIGCLVARYFISLATVKRFTQLKGNESLSDLVTVISQCQDMTVDTQLRVHEKRALNALNTKEKLQPDKEIIRFPLPGKIKTREMKINCLIQASLGCLPMMENSFNSDISRILKTGQRITKYLAEYLILRPKSFSVLVNAITLAKCFRARIWENSIYVSRQFDRVGVATARALGQSGLTSLQNIEDTDQTTIEMFAKRAPPFGLQLLQTVRKLPKYNITMEQLDDGLSDSANIRLTITLDNFAALSKAGRVNVHHGFYVIIGNQDDKIVQKHRLTDSILMGWEGKWNTCFVAERGLRGHKILAHIISESIVGIDVSRDFFPKFRGVVDTPHFPDLDSVASPLERRENWVHLCENSGEGVCEKRKSATCSNKRAAKRKKALEAFSVVSSRISLPSRQSKTTNYVRGPMDKFVRQKPRFPEDVPTLGADSESEIRGSIASSQLEGGDIDSDPELDNLVSNYEPKLAENDDAESAVDEVGKESETNDLEVVQEDPETPTYIFIPCVSSSLGLEIPAENCIIELDKNKGLQLQGFVQEPQKPDQISVGSVQIVEDDIQPVYLFP